MGPIRSSNSEEPTLLEKPVRSIMVVTPQAKREILMKIKL